MKVHNFETVTNTTEASNECELSDADLMSINGGIVAGLPLLGGLLGGASGGTDLLGSVLTLLGLGAP